MAVRAMREERLPEQPAYEAKVEAREHHQPRYDFKPPKEKNPTAIKDPRRQAMADLMATETARAIYRKRKQTLEPVFGIIKEVLGFRRFHLRGLTKVETEWQLVCLSYNFKRLFNLISKGAAKTIAQRFIGHRFSHYYPLWSSSQKSFQSRQGGIGVPIRQNLPMKPPTTFPIARKAKSNRLLA